MTAPLHVDPSALRAVAAAQSVVATTVAGLDIGAALVCDAEGTAELSSGAACRFAGEILDTSASALHGEISMYAATLVAAAAAYQQADEELGGWLGAIL